MWSAIKSIFATPKVIDAAIAGIDKSKWTDEERSDFFLTWITASAPQNLARRIIAFLVTGMWVIACVVILIQLALEMDVSEEMAFMQDTVNPPFMIIIGFYFLAHVIRANKKGGD